MPTSVNLPPGHKPSTHADEIVCEDPEQYHQYGRTLHKLEDIALRKKHRTWMTTCDWLWGPTGVG